MTALQGSPGTRLDAPASLATAIEREQRLAELGAAFQRLPPGSLEYAYEELIADFSSCMVGSVLGLPCDLENHASYLQSWLTVLRGDRRAIFRAAAAAQKVADWMLALHPDFAAATVGGAQAGGEDLDGDAATSGQDLSAGVA